MITASLTFFSVHIRRMDSYPFRKLLHIKSKGVSDISKKMFCNILCDNTKMVTRESPQMPGKFSLFVDLFLVLLRQVSVMRCGACEGSTGSLFTVKFLKVRRNRKSGNPAARALQLGRSVLSNVWTESASGLPRHQCWFYTNSSSAFKLLTTDPLPQPDTHTSCVASLRATSLNFDLIMPATNLALYQLKWNLHIVCVCAYILCPVKPALLPILCQRY